MSEPKKTFGDELRRRRCAANLSLADLADLVHYSKGHLSKIENGQQRPSPALARQCDAVLDANGALATLAPRAIPSAGRATRPTVGVGDPSAGHTMLIGGDRPPQASWLLGLDVGMFFPVGPDIPRSSLRAAANDEATLAIFRSMYTESIWLGELMSAEMVLPIVIAQTNSLRGLVAGAIGAARRSLLLLATLNATYAGWLALESGHDRAAKWWSDLAVEMAGRSGDVDLIAYVFIRRAQIALYHDDAVLTVTLSKRAQRDPRVAARFRGVAASREAQGHALAGDYDRCRNALDRSIELLAGVDGSSILDGVPLPPMFGGGATGYAVGYIVGWCLHDLGQSREASEILDQDIALIPADHRRAANRYAARRVLAHASVGEVDHACALAHELLDTAEVMDSAMTRLELRRVMRTLRRWRGHRSVRELCPRLAATLRTSVT